jgi:hypothetical protein
MVLNLGLPCATAWCFCRPAVFLKPISLAMNHLSTAADTVTKEGCMCNIVKNEGLVYKYEYSVVFCQIFPLKVKITDELNDKVLSTAI